MFKIFKKLFNNKCNHNIGLTTIRFINKSKGYTNIYKCTKCGKTSKSPYNN